MEQVAHLAKSHRRTSKGALLYISRNTGYRSSTSACSCSSVQNMVLQFRGMQRSQEGVNWWVSDFLGLPM